MGRKEKGKIFVPICHFCGVKGHIRPRCFTLMNLENNYEKTKFARYFQKPNPRPKIDLGNEPRKIWVKKSKFKCRVCFTCLRTFATNSWYFDSGYSRQMTGEKDIFVDYKPLLEGLVTCGDGVTTRVLGKRTLNVDGFPRFKNVLHVDGLKANLISINQICDLNLNVDFDLEKCVVFDTDGKCILEGFHSPNNYYTLTSPSHSCHKVNSNDIRHYFIRDLVDSNVLILKFVETGKQLPNIFTKSLDFVKFEFLRKSLGICSF